MASEYYPLRITRANPNTIPADGNRYWLRFYQPGEDDKITYAEAAEFVDKLFDVDPCIDPDQQPGQVVEITPEKIYQSAAEVFGYDLEACRKALTGDYVGEILVIRSHPTGDANKYQLVPSVGEILHRQKVAEPITLDLDISGATSHNLEWPNLGHFSAEWLGTVIGEAGVIQPPTIKSTGNTIYWEETATGTLRATFDTEYDRVRIKVPGKPDSGASAAGSAQNVKLLAFYHSLIFQGEMTAPPDDDSLSTAALTQLCGHMTATLANPYPMTTQLNPSSKRLSVVTGQGITRPPESDDDEYGCQDEASWLGDAAEYEKRCCHPPGNVTPETCLTYTARNPGGKAPSEAVQKQFMKDHPNGQLVGVGPAGRDDCGTITTSLDVAPGNCCDMAVDLSWNYDLSIEVIAPSSSGEVFVYDGLLPLRWKVRGQGFFTRADFFSKDAVTTSRKLRIYTDSTACGSCTITVTDGCSEIEGEIRSTAGHWQLLTQASWPGPSNLKFYDEKDEALSTTSVNYFIATRGSYKYRQAFYENWNSYDTSLSDTLAGQCAVIPAIAPLIADQQAAINTSIPLYISNDIYAQAYEAGDASVYSTWYDAPWESCAPGILCLEGHAWYSNLNPRYRCTSAAAAFLPVADSITVWKWTC